ncbi:ornithine--oxo-acid transaminase [Paenibacillus mesophilus]|uniref:ornithine--oxo-acid transaminase n=1 Tax=Paenibacillus mesophilus TaxID=2582849 RepID=UPI00110E65BA|nr:ornithine--oxo-acid transaminase [Paenibacillus mesophilus]TMV48123.1 ornithine--oxo-acid transaminase [Paenibacillus mesophilus]
MNAMNSAMENIGRYGANNYNPLPVMLVRGDGVWVEDPEGNRYLDMLSSYSALNYGHRHPRIVEALKEQVDLITLTSRAFHSEPLGAFYEKLARLSGKTMFLPMNTGAEAVETATKAARRWAYDKKGVPDGQAEIIVCEGNFHGRTITVTSFSSAPEYKRGFGPFTPGFKMVPYGDAEALEQAITPHTAAFLVEPIQGEAGIIVPKVGYISEAAELCKRYGVLLMADEIQTGFGRTGKPFACDWEQVVPDVYILGKALGGGVYPISAVAADRDVLEVFEPGSHGSTFGGNPLACACAVAAMDVFEGERLAERSLELGEYAMARLRSLASPIVKDIRGKGLFIGIELDRQARPYCERLMGLGVLCKETHDTTIRLAPPLTITREELDWGLERIGQVLAAAAG